MIDRSERPWHLSGMTLDELSDELDLDWECAVYDEYTDEDDGLSFTQANGARLKSYARPMFQIMLDSSARAASMQGIFVRRPSCPTCDNLARSSNCPEHGDHLDGWSWENKPRRISPPDPFRREAVVRLDTLTSSVQFCAELNRQTWTSAQVAVDWSRLEWDTVIGDES